MNFLASPPITRSDYANSLVSVGESHRQDASAFPITPETKESLLIHAVTSVFGDDSAVIKECKLGLVERNAMPILIFQILGFIPFEIRFDHQIILTLIWLISHIAISCKDHLLDRCIADPDSKALGTMEKALKKAFSG